MRIFCIHVFVALDTVACCCYIEHWLLCAVRKDAGHSVTPLLRYCDLFICVRDFVIASTCTIHVGVFFPMRKVELILTSIMAVQWQKAADALRNPSFGEASQHSKNMLNWGMRSKRNQNITKKHEKCEKIRKDVFVKATRNSMWWQGFTEAGGREASRNVLRKRWMLLCKCTSSRRIKPVCMY